jgi:hypothetical protein
MTLCLFPKVNIFISLFDIFLVCFLCTHTHTHTHTHKTYSFFVHTQKANNDILCDIVIFQDRSYHLPGNVAHAYNSSWEAESQRMAV